MTANRHTLKDGVARSDFFQGPDPAGLIMKNGAAAISVSAGHATDYGQTKCTVTITLACDQEADKLEQAFRAAFAAANSMAIDGMNQLLQGGELFSTSGGPDGSRTGSR